jgi:tRNA(fMet)-specific endonuclease VapC
MTYYLDTNTIIFVLNGKIPWFGNKVKYVSTAEIKIPSMVKAELMFGVHRCHNIEKKMEIITEFLDPYEIVPFDAEASMVYGRVKADLTAKRNMIGPNDLIIAATVLSRGGVLVTDNTKEFDRVEGLCVEDWSELR